jgi:hypothetical protein
MGVWMESSNGELGWGPWMGSPNGDSGVSEILNAAKIRPPGQATLLVAQGENGPGHRPNYE